MAYVLQQFIKILHDRVHEAPPSRLVMHDRSMDPLHLPRSPHVQQTSRVGTPWTAHQLQLCAAQITMDLTTLEVPPPQTHEPLRWKRVT